MRSESGGCNRVEQRISPAFLGQEKIELARIKPDTFAPGTVVDLDAVELKGNEDVTTLRAFHKMFL